MITIFTLNLQRIVQSIAKHHLQLSTSEAKFSQKSSHEAEWAYF